MEDVTHLLEHHRECVRHLWNSGFRLLCKTQDNWNSSDLRPNSDYHLQEQYSNIAADMFNLFVLDPIGRRQAEMANENQNDPEPLQFLHVVPSGPGVSIFIHRTLPSGEYWDDPINVIMKGEADLTLITYFDFDQFGYRDLEYYLVRIAAFDKHPHLVGRDALVRVRDIKVLHDEVSS